MFLTQEPMHFFMMGSDCMDTLLKRDDLKVNTFLPDFVFIKNKTIRFSSIRSEVYCRSPKLVQFIIVWRKLSLCFFLFGKKLGFHFFRISSVGFIQSAAELDLSLLKSESNTNRNNQCRNDLTLFRASVIVIENAFN